MTMIAAVGHKDGIISIWNLEDFEMKASRKHHTD